MSSIVMLKFCRNPWAPAPGGDVELDRCESVCTLLSKISITFVTFFELTQSFEDDDDMKQRIGVLVETKDGGSDHHG